MVGLAIPALFVSTKNIYLVFQNHIHYFFTPNKVECIISNIKNQTLVNEIENYINLNIPKDLLSLDQKEFYKKVKHAYPIIKSIEFSFLISKTLQIKVHGVTPWCLINDQYVLANKKRLFSKELFDSEELKNLKALNIDEKMLDLKITAQTNDLLQKIPLDIWRYFSVILHSPLKIELTPRTSPCKCHIITDTLSIHEKNKFAMLGSIFIDLCKRGCVTKKMVNAKTPQFAFDFRMKDQIIVKVYHSWGKGK